MPPSSQNNYISLLEKVAASSTSSYSMTPRRKRYLVYLPLAVLATVSASYLLLSGSDNDSLLLPDLQTPHGSSTHPAGSQYDLSKYVNVSSYRVDGGPGESFRDALFPNVKYMTSWINGGWTNDVMTYVNMVYLAKITDRIAIIPPFAPSHIGQDAGLIHVGDVFDVPRLSIEMGHPVIEWKDIKDPQSKHLDKLACWSNWVPVKPDEDKPRESKIPDRLALDVPYTAVPFWAKLLPHIPADWHVRFDALAALSWPSMREEALGTEKKFPSEHYNTVLPPDEQVMCFDFPYFVSATRTFEWEYDYSPAWRHVGKYLHWSPKMISLAEKYLRRSLALAEDALIPPFISIHVRRKDFESWCRGVAKHECFASLAMYSRRVEQIKDQLRQERGLEVTHVVMTSDETDAAWWEEVRALGWGYVDHAKERTAEDLGKWFPPILDAVFQSMGIGFVGTDQSTMSLLARRRVEDWHGGVTRNVRWGTVNADLDFP